MSARTHSTRAIALLAAAVVAIAGVTVATSAVAASAADTHVEGRVTDTTGAGLEEINYALYTRLSTGRYQTVQGGPFLTDANGYFTLDVTSGKTYKLQFFDTLSSPDGTADRVPYTTVWYGGTTQAAATTFTSASASIGTIALTAQSNTLAQNDEARIADYDYPALYADDYTSVSPVMGEHSRVWSRNGVPISGATEREYTVTGADAAATLTYRDTITYQGQVLTVDSVSYLAKKGTITAKTPKISGTARVGKTLKATSGAWSPSSAKKTYRWYNNGKAIKNATKTSYKLPSSSKGDRITVRVTATKTNYTTRTVTSKSVKIKAKS